MLISSYQDLFLDKKLALNPRKGIRGERLEEIGAILQLALFPILML